MIPILSLGVFFPFLFEVTGAQVAPQCLNVMTFNIRYGTAPDGENNWDKRKHLVLSVIREQSPDVLGLQEALRFQIDEVRKEFPEYGELGVGRDDGIAAGEYSSLLYRTSRLSPDTGGTFWFSDTPDLPGSMGWGNRYPRICTWAVFRDQQTEHSVAIYNIHWDHESQASREHSADLLLQTIEQTAGDAPVIVTGDFNAGERNPAIVRLKQTLRDSFRELHSKDDSVGTYHAFRGTTSGEKIDHVFVNPLLTVTGASIIRTQEGGRYPSDHFPVTASVCLKEER